MYEKSLCSRDLFNFRFLLSFCFFFGFFGVFFGVFSFSNALWSLQLLPIQILPFLFREEKTEGTDTDEQNGRGNGRGRRNERKKLSQKRTKETASSSIPCVPAIFSAFLCGVVLFLSCLEK